MALLPFPTQLPWADTKDIKSGLPSQTFKQYLSSLDTLFRTLVFPGGNPPIPVASGGTGQTTGSYVSNQSWTPTDASGAGLTFTSVSVAYSRAGNMVFVYGRLTYPVTADGSAAKIGGLPVAVPNQIYAQNFSMVGYSAALNSVMAVLTLMNSSTFALYNAAGSAVITNSQLSNGAIEFNVLYPAT